MKLLSLALLLGIAQLHASHHFQSKKLHQQLQTIHYLQREMPKTLQSIRDQTSRAIVVLPPAELPDPRACEYAETAVTINNYECVPPLTCNARIDYETMFNIIANAFFSTNYTLTDIQAAITFSVAEVGFLVEGILSGISELTTPTLTDLYPVVISVIAIFIPIDSFKSFFIGFFTQFYTDFLTVYIYGFFDQIAKSFQDAAKNPSQCDTPEVVFLRGISNYLTIISNYTPKLIHDTYANIQIFLRNAIYDIFFVSAGFDVLTAIQTVSRILMIDTYLTELTTDISIYLCNLQSEVNARIIDLTCGNQPIQTRSPQLEQMFDKIDIVTSKALAITEQIITYKINHHNP